MQNIQSKIFKIFKDTYSLNIYKYMMNMNICECIYEYRYDLYLYEHNYICN